MKCNTCNTDNRDQAIYCKHCGDKLPVAASDPLSGLVGLGDVKKRVADLIENIRIVNNNPNIRVCANTIIMGATGTGKTCLANAISRALYTAGVVKHPKPTVVDAVNWDEFLKDWDNNVKNLQDGILVIENVQKLVPDAYSRQVGQLDKLFSEMDYWNGKPVVILVGLPGGFREFIDQNPNERRKFEYDFRLDEYNAQELTAICIQTLTNSYQAYISADSYAKIERVFEYLVRNKPENWGNAHSAIKMAQEIYLNMRRRGGDQVIPDDIVGKEYRDKTAAEIMAELDQFVGIDNIRKEVQSILDDLEEDRQHGKAPEIKSHFVFAGNPGTGKTTIARKMADIFKAMGVLPIGHLVEATRDDLVVGYVGQTARQTNEMVDKALGGVLFIDEAYTLTQGGQGDFGKEAVDTLLKRLSDDKGKFVCIVAGYPKEMFDFLQANPGLTRRFNREIKFEDYNGAALTEIFRRTARKNGFAIDAVADANLRNFFDMMYETRTENFGNAGTVENVFDEAKKRYSARKKKAIQEGTYTDDMDQVLTRDDIEGDENTRELNLDDVLAEIDRDFVGMQEIKDTLRKMGKTIQVMRRQAATGGKAEPYEMHLMLTGNPGTGKTEIARRLGKMLKALKVLPTDKVIEVDKSDLVGQTVGSTPDKTMKIIKSAMGGILFIDEAYTLSDPDSGGSFGKEAIETLMKAMSDYKGKFVTVLAGYRTEMDGFVDVNPGISRRITHKIHIEDYSRDELLQIFLNMARKKTLKLTPEAEKAAAQAVDEIYAGKAKNFGNAGEMDKLLKATRTRMGDRLFELPDATDEQLHTIEASDIPVEQHKDVDADDVLHELDNLVGLNEVKSEIRELANNLRIEKMMAEMQGKKFKTPDDHYLFLGNPGTGKTTVARIMGKVLQSLGIVKTSKFVEVDRSKLVGQYIGQTAPIVNKVVDSAMGGILFIDEAYTLASNGPQDFGSEALATLLKRMEDDRGKFVCIAAGYTREMNDFLATNSGLSSRFNKSIHFEDYDAKALAQIFRIQAKSEHMTMTPDVELAMEKLFERLYENRGRDFGNAREVRNVMKKVKSNRSTRLVALLQSGAMPTPEQMQALTVEDFEL